MSINFFLFYLHTHAVAWLAFLFAFTLADVPMDSVCTEMRCTANLNLIPWPPQTQLLWPLHMLLGGWCLLVIAVQNNEIQPADLMSINLCDTTFIYVASTGILIWVDGWIEIYLATRREMNCFSYLVQNAVEDKAHFNPLQFICKHPDCAIV